MSGAGYGQIVTDNKDGSGYFIENKGQWIDSVDFAGWTDFGIVSMRGGDIYFEITNGTEGIVWCLSPIDPQRKRYREHDNCHRRH